MTFYTHGCKRCLSELLLPFHALHRVCPLTSTRPFPPHNCSSLDISFSSALLGEPQEMMVVKHAGQQLRSLCPNVPILMPRLSFNKLPPPCQLSCSNPFFSPANSFFFSFRTTVFDQHSCFLKLQFTHQAFYECAALYDINPSRRAF